MIKLFKQRENIQAKKDKLYQEQLKNLEELRNSYKKATAKYGNRYFPILDLEQRITHVMQTKGNLGEFFKHEVDFFMQLIQKAEAERLDKENRRKIHEKIEEIMKSNSEKIRKYPESVFPYPVPQEIRHFSGAITAFLDEYREIVEILFRGTSLWTKVTVTLSELDRFYTRGKPGIFLHHYLQNFSSLPELDMDSIERKILQTGGLNLYRLTKTMESEVSGLSGNRGDQILQVSYQRFPAAYDRWNGKNIPEILEQIIFSAMSIIEDFRLVDLVNHSFRNDEDINR